MVRTRSSMTGYTENSMQVDSLHPKIEPAESLVKRRNRPVRQYSSSQHTLLRSKFRNMHQMSTVIVGSAEVHFTIHTALLTASSPFFAAALTGQFSEANEQTVRLPEEKVDVFEWFVQWLYSGTLTSASSHACNEECPDHEHHHHHSHNHHHQRSDKKPSQAPPHCDGDLRNAAGMPKYFLLIDIYALSDRLLTTALSNHIVDTVARLSESTNSVPTPSDTWLLYGTSTTFSAPICAPVGLRASAPLRDLILDLFVYKKTDKLLASHHDDWHPLFLRDLVVRCKRPGPDALARHSLGPWLPKTWMEARACDACRDVIPPLLTDAVRAGARRRASDEAKDAALKCSRCERVYCARCVDLALHGGLEQGDPKFSMVGQDIGGCKPWISWDGSVVGRKGRGLCGRYHEHGPLASPWGSAGEVEGPEDEVVLAAD